MEPTNNTAGGGAFDAAPGSFEENFACEPVEAHMVAHEGAMCDDCGCAHAAYPVTQRGVRYVICEGCYEYACMVAEANDDAGEQEDDFEAQDPDWSDDEPELIVGSAAWWTAGAEDARDNGAYGLLTSPW